MKKALLLIPAALLLFSCARTKRKGVDKDKKKENKSATLPDNVSTNNSDFTLNLKACTEQQLIDLLNIQNTAEIYNASPSQENENAVLNACMKYNNSYSFGTQGQCEFIYNDKVVDSLQYSDALWDSVCVQFN